MKNMRSYGGYFSILFFLLFLSGCAGPVANMQMVPFERIVSAPEKGKSMVVFLRPSGFGFAIQSSVFEIIGDTPSLVGIVAARKRVSYQLQPGTHLFMVVGESADFMSADLKADRTYYALVEPRMGVWKARFSLRPVHGAEVSSHKFNQWLQSCAWVEKNDASYSWATANMASIKSKQAEYYRKWMSKDASNRPKLLPQDGI